MANRGSQRLQAFFGITTARSSGGSRGRGRGSISGSVAESEVHQIGISVAKWAAPFSRESVGGRGEWGHLGHVACKVNVASRRKKCIMQQQLPQKVQTG